MKFWFPQTLLGLWMPSEFFPRAFTKNSSRGEGVQKSSFAILPTVFGCKTTNREKILMSNFAPPQYIQENRSNWYPSFLITLKMKTCNESIAIYMINCVLNICICSGFSEMCTHFFLLSCIFLCLNESKEKKIGFAISRRLWKVRGKKEPIVANLGHARWYLGSCF